MKVSVIIGVYGIARLGAAGLVYQTTAP